MARTYFEDLFEGQCLQCMPTTITRDSIVDFARQFDPLPFHIDEEAAGASIFGGLIASSLHVLSASTRAVVKAQGDLAIVSGVGIDEVRMFNPVRPDDVLSFDARWADLKRCQSKPDRGFARLRLKIFNQKGEPVFEYGYQYLIKCRDDIANP